MDGQAVAETCKHQLVGRSLAGTPPMYSVSRANLAEATWLLLDMMRRAVVARQVVGASGTWRLSHGHSEEEALIT